MLLKYTGIILLALAAGCGRGSGVERAVVSGTVTFQGQPVADGMIRFIPDAGPASGAVIKEGRYEVKASGGAAAGVCRVEIRGFRQGAAQNRPAGGPQIDANPQGRVQFIPNQYNAESTLQVTVEAKQGQVHNFDLK